MMEKKRIIVGISGASGIVYGVRMLEALRTRVPGAQLAWEAPMACGYGACYGCVVERGGTYERLCIAGPVLREETWQAA